VSGTPLLGTPAARCSPLVPSSMFLNIYRRQ
jgi:hypothetical protein